VGKLMVDVMRMLGLQHWMTMNLANKIGFLCIMLATVCTVAHCAPEDTTFQVSAAKKPTKGPWTGTPGEAPDWLPKETVCDILEGTSVLQAPGCTITTTVSNCKWNPTTGQCACTATQTRSGPNC
jgi:hypothetical protein